MADRLRVACVQLNASASKAENLERMERLVGRAAATGAEVVVLPEKWNGVGRPDFLREIAETLESGETFAAMAGWAGRYGITLVGGSIAELREGRDKLSNTCAVFDPQGDLAAVYRKIHMFDVEVGGHVYRESEAEEPGEGPVVCEADGWNVGLTICYDLRFPELFRGLMTLGAELFVVPAQFQRQTGEAHWEVLLRARAIENQCFVAAAAQWGEFASQEEPRRSYGRSMIVGPWGEVLVEAPEEGTGVWFADLDVADLRRVRRVLPALEHRRLGSNC
jgi:deaminated glutathione amidase